MSAQAAPRRELILDRSLGTARAALLEDGALCELHVEAEDISKQTGSLFYGRVQAIRPAVRAAFVDIGLDKNAFLPLEKDDPLRCGDWLIVQADAVQPTRTKGLRVTRRASLAGRLLALFPGGEGVRVSKKLTDDALRAQLSALGEAICPPGFGLVLRTAAGEADEGELRAELSALAARWQAAQRRAAGMASPGALEPREPLEIALCRALSGTLSRAVVNDRGAYARLCDERGAGRVSPETAIEYYDEAARGVLLFDAFSLEGRVERALSRRVDLPCGGYLVFDRCEAMTVVDVNSGKLSRARSAEKAALTVDLEAADELMRQLRLRGVGGIVVADFIDLRGAENRAALLSRLEEAARRDRARVTVEGVTRLGLVELTRRREGEELERALCEPCPRCAGAGKTLSANEQARRLLRDIRRKALSGQRGPFLARCTEACARALVALGSPVCAPVYALAAPGKPSVRQLAAGEAPPQGAVLLDGSGEADAPV